MVNLGQQAHTARDVVHRGASPATGAALAILGCPSGGARGVPTIVSWAPAIKYAAPIARQQRQQLVAKLIVLCVSLPPRRQRVSLQHGGELGQAW
jgi:hypothetical protein